MSAKLDFEQVNSGFARVKFMADVHFGADSAAAVALCSSIVHDKLARWCRAWSPDKTCGFDAVPEVTSKGNQVVCTLHAIVPMAAVNACRRELTLG